MVFPGPTGALWELTDVSDALSGVVTSGSYLRHNGTHWVAYAQQDTLEGLEARLQDLEMQQVQLPTFTDIQTFSQSIMARFNTLDSSNTAQQETLNSLVAAYSDLKRTLNQLDATFTSHTGTTGIHFYA